MLEWEERDLKAGNPDTEGELLLQLREYKYQNTNTEIQMCKNTNTDTNTDRFAESELRMALWMFDGGIDICFVHLSNFKL